MKKDDESIVRFSVRLNVKIPQHAKVNAVLLRLDKSIYKSKAQFLIDAIEYYIDHYGEERFTIHDEDDRLRFATVGQLEEFRLEMLKEAQSVAKDEVIKQFGNLLKEMAGNANYHREEVKTKPVKKEIKEDDFSGSTDDEVMSELVSSWM